MPDPEIRFNELITKLREKNFRMTPQRIALIQLIAASEGHPSAAQLYKRIRVQFPTMSQSTVYKTLELLKEMNQVLEIDLRDDSHYDGNKPFPHPHLICTRCGKIVDGELELDPALVQNLARQTGYQIQRPSLSFYGLCPECQKQ